MSDSAVRYPSEALTRFTADVLIRHGMPQSDARLAASILIDADLSGVDTHGIANLATHDHYARGLRSGHVVPRPEVAVLRDSPVAAAWDSGGGFGSVIAHRAMAAAMDKAEKSGIGMVTIRDGRHFGANGYFAEMAARRGMLAMVSANTPVAGMPPDARRPVVGPNPFAFAAPLGVGVPLVLDISMTAASGSKVIQAHRAGRPVPEGWVMDAHGESTDDPAAMHAGGALELLGGRVAGHKGYGLALMVDALGMLAGNGSGVWQSGRPGTWTQGQWFACWRTDLFLEPDEFSAEMQRLADHLHEVPTTSGSRLQMPGERRAACRAERARQGIPLPGEIVSPLLRLAAETDTAFPEPAPSHAAR